MFYVKTLVILRLRGVTFSPSHPAVKARDIIWTWDFLEFLFGILS